MKSDKWKRTWRSFVTGWVFQEADSAMGIRMESVHWKVLWVSATVEEKKRK